MKRIIGLVLSIVMTIALFPADVYAAGDSAVALSEEVESSTVQANVLPSGIVAAISTELSSSNKQGGSISNEISQSYTNDGVPQDSTEEETDYSDEEIENLPYIQDIDFESPDLSEAVYKKKLFSSNIKIESSYQLGTVREILDAADTNARVVKLQCLYIGTYCTVWGSTNDQFRQLSTSDAATIGQQFDAYYDSVTQYFGSWLDTCDADHDGKLSIFCYDIENNAANGFPSGGYTAGYFYYNNLATIASPSANSVCYGDIGNVGNIPVYSAYAYGTDCIHIDTYPLMGYKGSEYINVGNAYSTLIHELQHLISFSELITEVQNKGKLWSSIDPEFETYMNEAFSMAAEHIICGSGTVSDRASYYVSNDYVKGSSLTYWDSSNIYTLLSNYTNSYLFGQYLRIRYGQLTYTDGKSFYKEFYKKKLADSKNTTTKDSLTLAADMLNTTPQQLVNDFWCATFLNKDSGIYGFNGETWATTIYGRLSSGSISGIYNGGCKFFSFSNNVNYTSSNNLNFVSINDITKTSGTYSNGIKWSIVNTTLIIEKVGTATEIPDNEQPWGNVYRDAITEVNIEEGITHIGKGNFANCSRLKIISLSSVSTIAADAFTGVTANISCPCTYASLSDINNYGGTLTWTLIHDESNKTAISHEFHEATEIENAYDMVQYRCNRCNQNLASQTKIECTEVTVTSLPDHYLYFNDGSTSTVYDTEGMVVKAVFPDNYTVDISSSSSLHVSTIATNKNGETSASIRYGKLETTSKALIFGTKSVSLNLEGKIRINYTAEFPEAGSAYTEFGALFFPNTITGTTQNLTTAPTASEIETAYDNEQGVTATSYDSTKNTYKFQSPDLAAKNMSNNIYIVLYVRDKNNKVVFGTPKVCSVNTYKNLAFKSSSDNKLLRLTVDMLNYGADAQRYFTYQTDNLANAGMTSAQSTYATTSVPTLNNTSKAYKDSLSSDRLVITSASLSLESEVGINYIASMDVTQNVSNTSDGNSEASPTEVGSSTDASSPTSVTSPTELQDIIITEAKLLVMNNYTEGEEFDKNTAESQYVLSKRDSDGKYVATVPNIPAKEMRKLFYCRAYMKDSNGTEYYSDIRSYSVENYAYRAYYNKDDALLKNLVISLMRYGDSAQNYFGN